MIEGNAKSVPVLFVPPQVRDLIQNRWNLNVDNDLMQLQGREIGDLSLEIQGKKVSIFNSGFNRALQGPSFFSTLDFK